jgi:rod shape-determining protein MreC
VSSGLDGIFPAGYPVATITKVDRNPSETFSVVEARPLAQLDRSREVLLLWADPSTQPAAAAPAPETKPPVEVAAPAISPVPTTTQPPVPEPATRNPNEPVTPPAP